MYAFLILIFPASSHFFEVKTLSIVLIFICQFFPSFNKTLKEYSPVGSGVADVEERPWSAALSCVYPIFCIVKHPVSSVSV